jgi:hypothetical protein
MQVKEQIGTWSANFVIFVMLFLAIGYIFLAIDVNSGRIASLKEVQDTIQAKINEISSGQIPPNPEQLLQELSTLYQERRHIGTEISFGNFAQLGFAECLLPLNPNCFHRNSTEQNNMWLAVASGLLGAILFLLIAFRVAKTSEPSNGQNEGSFLSVVYLLATGMIMGLLVFFILRGTKGALLTPVSDVVQVESPYGIAFACTLAGLFSDRIFQWLSKLVDILPSR